MARILTGIQATGTPHLGNLLGAIMPGIALSNNPQHEAFFFIANLHSLISIKDAAAIEQNTRSVAASWLAMGLDTNKNTFYRQSDVPEVCELTWYLNCFTPFPMLGNAHSFKDKQDKLSEVNAGLFTYPVLMAADIVLYDANVVPVGKDQKQHLEMTRDMASALNKAHGGTLVIPEARIDEAVMVVPGTDGRKMSKSYGNTITVFSDEKALRKQVMSIVTDSTPVEEPKNADTCHVFQLYKLVANEADAAAMRANYERGGYGYGAAKTALFELLLSKFSAERSAYAHWINDTAALDAELKRGAEKARAVAKVTLSRVRAALGYA